MQLEYKRPNVKEDIETFENILDLLKTETNVQKTLLLIQKINTIRESFFSMEWISYISYLQDTQNSFFQEEEQFFARYTPVMENLKLTYYQVLKESPIKETLQKEIGEKVFLMADCASSLRSEEVAKNKKKIKILANEYGTLMSKAIIPFQGENVTLKQLKKYKISFDRNIRKKAHETEAIFMESIEEKIDTILEKLIQERTEYAHKLGFTSYTDVGYLEMYRIGYGKKEVNQFCEEIATYLVPYIQKLKEKQRENLDISSFYYYDNNTLFKDGNAKIKGDSSQILEIGKKIYKEISPAIYTVFKMMVDEKLLDVESRKGKSAGGITTYIPTIKKPIFISNFNGTSGDISVLTHEFGHSLQLYESRDLLYYENWWPTFDTCEIHSTSMQLLMLPHIEPFFISKKDASKFAYESLLSILELTCTACMGEQFQQMIYDNPSFSKEKRKQVWHDLEQKYQPWIRYENNAYLEKGNGYQKINHFFGNPFYYIDYALANIVSLQLYRKSVQNEKEAWDIYMTLCKQGGKYPFIETVQKAHLKSPFEKGVVKELTRSLSL